MSSYAKMPKYLFTRKVKFFFMFRQFFSQACAVLLTLNPTALKVYCFPISCVPSEPTFLWLINNMAAKQTPISSHELIGRLTLPICSQNAKTIIKTYSESLLPGNSHYNFGSVGLFEPSNRRLKMRKQSARSFTESETYRNLSDHFVQLDDNAQLRIGLES